MPSLLEMHTTHMGNHVGYFANTVEVNKGTANAFQVSVIWNQIEKLAVFRGVSDVLDEKGSIFIDNAALAKLGKTIKKGDTITGKINSGESEQSFVIEEIYEDKMLAAKLCFLKHQGAAIDWSTDI